MESVATSAFVSPDAAKMTCSAAPMQNEYASRNWAIHTVGARLNVLVTPIEPFTPWPSWSVTLNQLKPSAVRNQPTPHVR